MAGFKTWLTANDRSNRLEAHPQQDRNQSERRYILVSRSLAGRNIAGLRAFAAPCRGTAAHPVSLLLSAATGGIPRSSGVDRLLVFMLPGRQHPDVACHDHARQVHRFLSSAVSNLGWPPGDFRPLCSHISRGSGPSRVSTGENQRT